MLFDDMDNEFDDLDDDDNLKEDIASRQILKPPRGNSLLSAHGEIEKHLIQMVGSGKMPQSLIFTGMNGIGKSTMAFRLARYLFKYKNKEEGGGLFGGFDSAPEAPHDTLFVPEADSVFQQVASGGWSDLLTIQRQEDEKGKLKPHDLDEVRATTNFFRRTASQDGGWRIAIIDDADTMNWHAQNALLKILEEPPEKSLLILISHRLGALLPTILSRATVINFQPMKSAEVKDFLISYGEPLTEETENLIVAMSAGSVGQALYYAEKSRSETIEHALCLLEPWPALRWDEIQSFAENIGGKGSDESSQIAFRDVMLWLVSSLARSKSISSDRIDGLNKENGHRLLSNMNLDALIKLYDGLSQHFNQVQTASLDKRYMVMQAYALWEK